MSQIEELLLENWLSLISIFIGIGLAFYLYILEKRRDEKQIKQTEEFNKWMKEQTERQTAVIEALQKSLPKAEADKLTQKVADMLPGSIQIGDIIITRANIRIAQSFLGGGTYVEAVAFGEEGERLKAQFEKLEEWQVVKFVSPDHKGITQVKDIKIDITEGEGVKLYTFHIWLQIKG